MWRGNQGASQASSQGQGQGGSVPQLSVAQAFGVFSSGVEMWKAQKQKSFSGRAPSYGFRTQDLSGNTGATDELDYSYDNRDTATSSKQQLWGNTPPSPRSKLAAQAKLPKETTFSSGNTGSARQMSETYSSNVYTYGQKKETTPFIHDYGHTSTGDNPNYSASDPNSDRQTSANSYRDNQEQKWSNQSLGRDQTTSKVESQGSHSDYPTNIKGYMDFVREQRERAGVDGGASQIPGIGDDQFRPRQDNQTNERKFDRMLEKSY